MSNRLSCEIDNFARQEEDGARCSPHAAKQRLSNEEFEAKRRELPQLARNSLSWRTLKYFVAP